MPNLQANTFNQSKYDFPHPSIADPDGHGMIAVGGDLDPQTLIHAYSMGLFPWFNAGEPIAWWSPEPRCVVYPEDFQPKKSLKKTIRKSAYWLSVNLAFSEVIYHCAMLRDEGTWITDEMMQAYCTLNDMGFAHSIEVWSAQPIIEDAPNTDAELIGGLYGLKLGTGFFGESMFHTRTDCSKVAFTFLNKLAIQSNIELIDCQLENPHLMSLGAVCIQRQTFLNHLEQMVQSKTSNWQDFSTNNQCFPVNSLLDNDFMYL